MVITYTDGGTLKVTSIIICGDSLYCDDYYVVPLSYVESIDDDNDIPE